MKEKKHSNLRLLVMAIIVIGIMIFAAVTTTADSVQHTFWALVPPVIAIVLALVTKEVYSSLFIGILTGGLLYSGFSFEGTLTHVFQDGMIATLADAGHVGILVFLVILGAMVALMNKAGGSAAFGRWASRKIKTRAGAQVATIILGILIFIDDYFNCLTVGSVMRPVTDRHNVSRAKLAYLIDSTAAPVCIIAPVSSWAAAVSSSVEGKNGFSLFIRAIPYNFYALFTILMMFMLVLIKVDFGPMALYEKNALNGDIFTNQEQTEQDRESADDSKGSVLDLLIPIVSLIICCIIGMIYTGGFFSGTNFVEAFANSDASVGLVLGSFFALVITILLYLIRGVLPFKECMDCIPDGFKSMVPAMLILTFAWTLNGMTQSLGAKEYVAGVVQATQGSFMSILPAVIFLVGLFLAFATGTSWGTFGILIPIVVAAFNGVDENMMVISISACMAGSVCGDHCSPISDTTIMASAGAQCDHLNHVSTQLPYAMFVATISFVTYIIAGFVKNPWISLAVGAFLLIGSLALLHKMGKTQKHDNMVVEG
jgi:tetracycline resistance efflux pump